MFTRHRHDPPDKLTCPHAMGTKTHSTPSLRSVAQARLRLFTTDASCRVFESALERVRRSYRLYVYGYVVTPEHVHLLLSEPSQQQVPFDFAQGRLPTPRIVAFAMICSGRDDRVGEI